MKYSKSLRIISNNILAVNPERFRRALASDGDPQVVSGTQRPKGRRSLLVRAGSESTHRGRLRGALLRAGAPRPAVRGVAAASRCIEPGRPAGRDTPSKCGKSRSGADTSAFRTRNGELRSRWWSEKEAMRRRSCDRRRRPRGSERDQWGPQRRSGSRRGTCRCSARAALFITRACREPVHLESSSCRVLRRGTDLRELEPSGLASKPKLVSS